MASSLLAMMTYGHEAGRLGGREGGRNEGRNEGRKQGRVCEGNGKVRMRVG